MTDSRTDCIPSPQTLFRKETAKGEGEKEEERKGKKSNSLSHRLFLASSGIVDALSLLYSKSLGFTKN